MRRCVCLSVVGIGTCCSAVSFGSDGGGSDWVPTIVMSVRCFVMFSISITSEIDEGNVQCSKCKTLFILLSRFTIT
jgi:hypothetical protein